MAIASSASFSRAMALSASAMAPSESSFVSAMSAPSSCGAANFGLSSTAFCRNSAALPSKPPAETMASPRYASASDGFMKKVAGIVIVKTLKQQHSPAYLVKILTIRRLRREAELLVGLLPLFQSPETFRAHVCIAATRQLVEAGVCLGHLPMLAERPTIRGNRGAHRHSTYQGACHHDDEKPHLSSSSCTFAS